MPNHVIKLWNRGKSIRIRLVCADAHTLHGHCDVNMSMGRFIYFFHFCFLISPFFYIFCSITKFNGVFQRSK